MGLTIIDPVMANLLPCILPSGFLFQGWDSWVNARNIYKRLSIMRVVQSRNEVPVTGGGEAEASRPLGRVLRGGVAMEGVSSTPGI